MAICKTIENIATTKVHVIQFQRTLRSKKAIGHTEKSQLFNGALEEFQQFN